MDTVETLRAARDLIADPEHWCKDNWAMDGAGNPTYPRENAVRWCALGALREIKPQISSYGTEEGFLKEAALLFIDASYPASAPAKVNDELGHAAVMDMYDLAIRLAKDSE